MEYQYGIKTCHFLVLYHKKSLIFVVGGFFGLLDVHDPLDVTFCLMSCIVKKSDATVGPLNSLNSLLVTSGLLLVASCEAWYFRLAVPTSIYTSSLSISLSLLLEFWKPLNANFCSLSCNVTESGIPVALSLSLHSFFVYFCVTACCILWGLVFQAIYFHILIPFPLDRGLVTMKYVFYHWSNLLRHIFFPCWV